MAESKLGNTLRRFEKPGAEPSIGANENDKDSVRTLENDINRIDFKFYDFKAADSKEEFENLFKNLLFELLRDFPLKYTQGMSEVASVLVVSYFKEKVEDKMRNPEFRKLMASAGEESATFRYEQNSQKTQLRNFLNENKGLVDRSRMAMANILQKYFIVYFDDGFKLYKEHNKVFRRMMKLRGIKIPKDESIKYMGHILTFFKRVVGNENVANEIYNVILNSDPSILFSLMAVFYDRLKNYGGSSVIKEESRIVKLEDNFLNKLMEQHEIFIKTRIEVEKQANKPSKAIYYGIAMGGVCLAAALFYGSRNGNGNK